MSRGGKRAEEKRLVKEKREIENEEGEMRKMRKREDVKERRKTSRGERVMEERKLEE